MSSIAYHAASHERAVSEQDQRTWRISAISLMSVRVIQGFIYWGGGSRRFIYAPGKLNPHAAHWMANKFQTAMPGALLGMDHVISFMLHHFYLLYGGVILFSAAELIVGLMLMAGLFTRAAALASMGFSVLLMLMFGWQGATCIDEWTMAACNLAMGATLMLGGSGAWSLDNVLLRNKPQRADSGWFKWASGSRALPLSDTGFRNLALAVLTFVVVFNVGTYSYYRGSVVTPFHSGPISPTAHHLTLARAAVLADGSVRFHVALDAGTAEAPVHVVAAELLDANRAPVAQWNAEALSKMPKTAFNNDYAYNKFGPGPFGLRAAMGAASTVTLPAPTVHTGATVSARTLQLTDVDGRVFSTSLQDASGAVH
ncbi:quinol oxidase [Caballeronia mineralivorans PML1(12)]|uniref:Quinol oxidase n=1 Tax=Caballeronia mineralivorans PML1(12) TaxID=908627 RepID=A0A0J1CUF0_9BURK|nr:TQO small subunit DoxD [Caballeronia mineralivorans]KLU24224.1 quinol oxidase [Caballeronia mineralivorans PML1(12)]